MTNRSIDGAIQRADHDRMEVARNRLRSDSRDSITRNLQRYSSTTA
jgi:hypothetical protein